MAKQTIRVGAVPRDGTGDPARTAMQKINLNFAEIYDFLNGAELSDSLPNALPVERGGTGGTTQALARQSLGLGNGATLSVGDTEGSLLAVGSFGLGTDLSPTVLPTDPNKPSDFRSGEFAYLYIDDISTVSLASRTASHKAQLGVQIIDDIPRLMVRGSFQDTFKPWRKVFTEANAVVTVNGNVKAADNVLQLSRLGVVSSKGTEHTFTRTDVGLYTVTNAAFKTSGWTLEVPMDYKGNVLFEAQLTQSGTAIQVAVTKAGAAYDIPDGQWIDINIA